MKTIAAPHQFGKNQRLSGLVDLTFLNRLLLGLKGTMSEAELHISREASGFVL
jgi:hypothetical protein